MAHVFQRVRDIGHSKQDTDNNVSKLPVCPSRLGEVSPQELIPDCHSHEIETPTDRQRFPGVVRQIKYGMKKHLPDVPANGQTTKDHARIKQVDDRRLDEQEEF